MVVNNLGVLGALEISDISEHSETKDDWTWDNHDGNVTPTKLLQTPNFKSATAKNDFYLELVRNMGGVSKVDHSRTFSEKNYSRTGGGGGLQVEKSSSRITIKIKNPESEGEKGGSEG